MSPRSVWKVPFIDSVLLNSISNFHRSIDEIHKKVENVTKEVFGATIR